MIIAITADQFELPMAVYDSAHDAARKLHTSPSTISKAIHKNSISGLMGKRKARFIRIEEDDDNED